MSHFTVWVIGDDHKKELAPFQENNMGDCPKEYLEFRNVEGEYRQEYNNDSVDMVKVPNGVVVDEKHCSFHDRFPNHHFTWAESFKRRKNGGSIFDTEECLPEGSGKVTIPLNKLYLSFEEFMDEWVGCGKNEETGEYGEYGYWENPNAKWDWYKVGGRWAGSFHMKKVEQALIAPPVGTMTELGFTAQEMNNFFMMYNTDRDKFDKVVVKYNGKTEKIISVMETWADSVRYAEGVQGEKSWGMDGVNIPKNHVDIAKKGDIDMESMSIPMADHAAKMWDYLTEMDAAGDDKEKKTVIQEKYDRPFMWKDPRIVGETRENHIKRQSVPAPYALIWDGKWCQKGEMLMFGIST